MSKASPRTIHLKILPERAETTLIEIKYRRIKERLLLMFLNITEISVLSVPPDNKYPTYSIF
jgi:hypothetical protein